MPPRHPEATARAEFPDDDEPTLAVRPGGQQPWALTLALVALVGLLLAGGLILP